MEIEPKRVTEKLKRIFKELTRDSGSSWYVCCKVRRWFTGHGWETYLSKEEGHEVIADNRQQNIKELLCPNVPLADRKAVAPWKLMDFYSRLWKEYRGDAKPHSPVDCMILLNQCGYKYRRIVLPKSGKDLRGQAVHLYRYLTGYEGKDCIDDEVDSLRAAPKCGSCGNWM